MTANNAQDWSMKCSTHGPGLARMETMNATKKHPQKNSAEVPNTCGQQGRGDAQMAPGATN